MKLDVGLTILFVGLKLMGFINWSWFWVLSPMIISICLAIILVFIQDLNDKRKLKKLWNESRR